ncbi:hypothetical protein AU255_02695 [Methyloprofundus sedimenti]|uniref:GtrA/DPMS transmembrane domain-containing protein n=1 Tax=Methyloprofundus sedimenti TaxID=1420851 RepID=A0A1V8M5I9_9GAMM|nr:GtrA family protein [Methyloprofundus sedimenti]OQK16830.1 hypothetical protein AU255_02695 [Methyloprofundus sedimenti]
MNTPLLVPLRYILSGGIAYLVDITLFAILQLWFQLPIIHANIAARSAGAIAAFMLNKFWTFNASNTKFSSSLLRYLSLWLINTALSSALLLTLKTLSTTMFYIMGLKVLIETLLILSNFIICKLWVFKKI